MNRPEFCGKNSSPGASMPDRLFRWMSCGPSNDGAFGLASRLALLSLVASLGWSCQAEEAPEPDITVFSRHYLEAIYLEDRPAPEEVNRPISLLATPGEYEPASLGVRAGTNLKNLTVTAGDLQGEDGAVIPASAFTVLVTRYIDPLQRWRPIKGHPRPPGYLDARDAVDLDAHTTQQFWITVQVPEEAAAGVYRGRIEVSAEMSQDTSGAAGPREVERFVDYTLEVLPFTLRDADPAIFLFGNNFPLDEEVLADSRAHGMNTICVNHGWPKQTLPKYRDGDFDFRGRMDRVTEVIEAARRHGLGVDRPIGLMMYKHLVGTTLAALGQGGALTGEHADLRSVDYGQGYELFFEKGEALDGVDRHKGPYYPVPDPDAIPTTPLGKEIFNGWVAAMKAFEELGKEKGWPPLFFYLIDEPHKSRGSMRLAKTMLRAAVEAKVDAMITCNEPTVSEPDPAKLWFPAIEGEPALRLLPGLTTRVYHNKYLGPETRQRTAEDGGTYGTYVNIYGNQPASVRYQVGYLTWRLDTEVVMLWQWKNVSVEFNGGRSYLREWEAAREGVDDLRYIEALERVLEAGQGSEPARAEARALLDRVRAEIVPNVKAIGFVDGVSGRWVPGSNAWSAAQYDEMRHRIARAIVSLLAVEEAAPSE